MTEDRRGVGAVDEGGANPLIEALGLQTYYGASHILHGVDFRVGAAQTIGLMGRNGMGKSTLL